LKALSWSQGFLDEYPRPKSGKLRLNLHGTCFEGKMNWFGPKNGAKRRAPDLENQESPSTNGIQAISLVESFKLVPRLFRQSVQDQKVAN
jgi:hypothetical protein